MKLIIQKIIEIINRVKNIKNYKYKKQQNLKVNSLILT